MRVYVARHGETTWNRAGRYQGRRESDLSPLGESQALALAGAMERAGVGRIVSSPLRRCTATAQPSAERLGVSVEIDERLIEIAHGTWEGRLRDEIAANDPARYRAWREDPAHVAFEGGETIGAVLERWRSFAASVRPGEPTLVVTHDAVVRVALCDAAGGDLRDFWRARVQNGGYAVFDADDSAWTLVEECAGAHLAGIAAATETQAL
ncbi:MAG TPA: histidine phosphatase family protein [Candidatus Baltobacteraceae bacterium]|nr:histidine phosphatase family protein [Candidatus Baltobacteraceae bacterium]